MDFVYSLIFYILFIDLANGSNRNLKKSQDQSKPTTTTKMNNKENQKNGENMPEMYLDSSKLDHIRSWVDEVNRVQAKSGKWGETINKILFYD